MLSLVLLLHALLWMLGGQWDGSQDNKFCTENQLLLQHIQTFKELKIKCTYSGPSTYRLFELQTSLATKFRFDLQPENQPTDQKKPKMEQKWPAMALIGFQCIVGQWRLNLQTFWPATTVPIQINSVNRGSTVQTSQSECQLMRKGFALENLQLFSSVDLYTSAV